MREPHELEPRWHAAAAVVGAIVLYATLPGRFVLGSGTPGEIARWIVPGLGVLLLGPLVATSPRRRSDEESPRRRRVTIVLAAILSIANAASMELLVHQLLIGSKMDGRTLFRSAVAIWLTNVAVFGLWFWQLDRGGPSRRAHGTEGPPDFAFPQMTDPEVAAPGWRPLFFDYFYVAFTNGTAFSPTDTMPLSHTAKALMAVQAGLSLVIVALVAARAVNILR